MPWGQRLAMSSSKTSPVCPPAIPSPLTSAHTRALISFFTLAQSERGGLSWWWSCRHDCQNRGWGAGAAGSLGLRVKERQRQRKKHHHQTASGQIWLLSSAGRVFKRLACLGRGRHPPVPRYPPWFCHPALHMLNSSQTSSSLWSPDFWTDQNLTFKVKQQI